MKKKILSLCSLSLSLRNILWQSNNIKSYNKEHKRKENKELLMVVVVVSMIRCNYRAQQSTSLYTKAKFFSSRK
jgi:hypothetical protein